MFCTGFIRGHEPDRCKRKAYTDQPPAEFIKLGEQLVDFGKREVGKTARPILFTMGKL